MYDTFNACNTTISTRERLHAAVSYSRPPGNIDPDGSVEQRCARAADVTRAVTSAGARHSGRTGA